MFTGIIETLGKVTELKKVGSNLNISVESSISNQLKKDQSVSHNGICLTVTHINNNIYTITAIEETLKKTNLKNLQIGDLINLERAMPANGRFDGHIVQGHIDTTATCINIESKNGSHLYTFKLNSNSNSLLVEKGSICINGISLTVFNIQQNTFSVAIIPYTYAHTNFNTIISGSNVNIEFDILGKYVAKALSQQRVN